MQALLQAAYVADLKTGGRKTALPLTLTVHAGENLYLQGSPERLERHFLALCGLKAPELGSVALCGWELYRLPPAERAALRRDRLGGIPAGGGLMPELPLLEQVKLPMLMAGMSGAEITARLEQMDARRLLTGSCPARNRAFAALLRALARQPQVLVLDRFPEGFEELDADLLWQTLNALRRADSALICLGGGPAPERVAWTRQLRV